MGFHDLFGHLKHKLWPKERLGVKVVNHPNFFVFRWCATYRWKAFDKGYNFALDLISFEGFHTKL